MMPVLLAAAHLPGQTAFLEEAQQKWENAAAYTLELAELMPDSAYAYRPVPEVRTFEEQLLHAARNMNWLTSSYLGGEKTDKDLERTGRPKEEVIAILEETLSMAAEAIAKLTAEQLDEQVDFFAGPMSKRQILLLLNDHLTHHRGQAIIYLRMVGGTPPRYRGW